METPEQKTAADSVATSPTVLAEFRPARTPQCLHVLQVHSAAPGHLITRPAGDSDSPGGAGTLGLGHLEARWRRRQAPCYQPWHTSSGSSGKTRPRKRSCSTRHLREVLCLTNGRSSTRTGLDYALHPSLREGVVDSGVGFRGVKATATPTMLNFLRAWPVLRLLRR